MLPFRHALAALFVCLPSLALALPSVPGDLDENGSASIRDVLLLVRHLEGTTPLAVPLIPFADADQDGAVIESDIPDHVDVVLGLPAAPTRMISAPGNGDAEVAVTRETIFRFRRPLLAGVEPPAGAIVATLGDTLLPGTLHASQQRDTLTLFYAGLLPASSVIRVTVVGDLLTDALGRRPDVDGDGVPGGTTTVDFETLSLLPVPATSVCGTVLASAIGDGGVNEPLQGVHVTVDGAEATLFAHTDAFGNFCIDPSPAGTFFARVDGGTATNATDAGAYYPAVGKAWRGEAGRQVHVGIIHLPLVAPGTLQPVSMTLPTRITFPQALADAHPELRGVHLEVPPDAPFFDDGRRGGLVGIGPVPSDRLPGQLPEGLGFAIVITVQTGDPLNPAGPGPSNFDVPVPACFPNLPDPTTGETLAVGEKTALWSFNHDTGMFEVAGPATIVQDGDTTLACSDPGVGILAPGWHGVARGSGGSGKGSPRLPDGRRKTPPVEEDVECPVEQGVNGAGAGSAAVPCKKPPAECPVDEGTGALHKQAMDDSTRACKQQVYRIASRLFAAAGAPVPCRFSHLPGRRGKFAKWLCKKLDPDVQGLVLDTALSLAECMVWACDCVDLHANNLADPRGAYEQNEEDCVRFRANLARLQRGREPLAPAGVLQGVGAAGAPDAGDLTNSMLEHVLDRFALDDAIAMIAGDANAEELTEEQLAQLEPLLEQDDRLYGGREPAEFYRNVGERHEAELVTALASNPGEFSEGDLFFSLENLDAGFVQRGRTGRAGSFGSLALVANVNYRIRKLFPDTLQYTEDEFLSSGNGQATTIPRGAPEDDDGPDGDGDFLGDDSEFVLGTNPALADTDGDGLRDDAEILNGSDPLDNAPQSLGVIATVDTPGYARDACTGPNLVAVADSQAGVAIFNVFNGRTPRLVAQVDTPGNASRVAFSGTHVVAADGNEGVVVIPINDPPSAAITHQIDLSGNVVAVAAERGRALVGLRHLAGSAIVLVDLTTGGELGRVAVPGAVHDVAFSGAGGLALTLEGSTMTLSSIDLSAPLAIRSAASAPGLQAASGRPLRLATDGVSAWAVHANGFAVFDVADPRNVTVDVEPASVQFGWKHLVPDGSGFALVAVDPNSGDGGVHDVFLHDVRPGAGGDAAVASFQTPGIAEAVAICGGLGFVADGSSGLQVVRYRGSDSLGLPPTLAIVTDFPALAVPAGEGVLATARVTDDVQVARVEFTVDNVPVSVDCAYPFQARFAVPAELGREVALSARAFDTGGNNTTVQVLLTTVADPRAPLVVSVSPRPDRITEPVDAVTIVLSKPILFSSVGPASVLLLSAGGDDALGTPDDMAVPGTVMHGTATHSIAFSTAGALAPGVYRITLAPTVTDLEGHPVAGIRTWAFRVIPTTDDDADGVRDEEEPALGLDTADGDSDDDGRLDGDEDPDGDGLSNAREAFLGTDALDTDTDDDGVSDRVEAEAGCPPTVPGTTTVAGRVLAPAGDVVFEGAMITLAGLPGFAAMSAADGTFAIASVPSCLPIQVRVRATIGAERLIARSGRMAGVAGGTTDAMDLVLATPGLPRFQWDCVAGLPHSLTRASVGDLDGDGLDDVLAEVQVNTGRRYMAVARGNGEGSVGQLEEVLEDDGNYYEPPPLMDVDGDGDLDIVRIGFSMSRIWRGAGDGTFGAPQTLAFTGSYGALAVGRLDADPFVDLVLGGRIARGQADGSFIQGDLLATEVVESQAGDLDGDGDVDLVMVLVDDDRHVFLNDGLGSFVQRPVTFDDGSRLRLADVNGDTVPDLLSIRSFAGPLGPSYRLRFERGLGTGLFAPSQETELAGTALSFALEDRDGDGDLDAIVGFSSVEVLLNDGSGTFTPTGTRRLPTGFSPHFLADLDDLGPRELVAVGVGSLNRLLVVPPEAPVGFAGPGAFTLGAPFDADFASIRVAVGDVTGDGRDDVITPQISPFDVARADVLVLAGDGAGSLGAPIPITLTGDGGASGAAIGDVDEDGDADILALVGHGNSTPRGQARTLVVAVNDGQGGFSEGTRVAIGGSGIARDLGVADMDVDGHLDVVVGAEGRIDVFRGFGDGTFAPALDRATSFSLVPELVVVAEMTGDGVPDVAYRTNRITLLPGLGDGTLGTERNLTLAGHSPELVAAGDLDGDGDVDLVSGSLTFQVQPWLNDGVGNFTPGTGVVTEARFQALVLADMNQDDVLDIVLSRSPGIGLGGSQSVLILVNAGDATFPRRVEACEIEPAIGFGVSDLDADGLPDLIRVAPRTASSPQHGGVEIDRQR